MEAEKVVLAIDPGRAKCGVAVVSAGGAVRHRAVVTTESLVEEARQLVERFEPKCVVIGNGTGARPLILALEAAELGVPLREVDEFRTSEAARVRCVAENPPGGWQRWLPRSLRTPDRPYDDYVAVILAERYWQEKGAA